jgi:hypothetical protein
MTPLRGIGVCRCASLSLGFSSLPLAAQLLRARIVAKSSAARGRISFVPPVCRKAGASLPENQNSLDE